MRAYYTGDYPGYIDIDLDGDSMTVSMANARDFLSTLEVALREAEDGMPTLYPCPFCGKAAHTVAFMAYPTVVCDHCGIQVTAKTWKEVVAKWNRRSEQ